MVSRRLLAPTLCLLFWLPISARAGETAVQYTVSLAGAADHRVQVKIDLPPGTAQRNLQLPTWNALYQIRDFSQFVFWVRARDAAGAALPVRKLNKSLWRVEGAAQGASLEYEIFADSPPPFGAQLDERHGFFNPAQILMYPVDARSAPVRIEFRDLPAGWKTASPLQQSGDAFVAENYDQLADSPFELSNFQEVDFDEGGGHYRVIVDSEAENVNLTALTAMLRPIVASATAWMDDRPYQTYTFFYHFPQTPSGGGMEHAYSTAINFTASRLDDAMPALASLTAHEFFHLWNVKRIRPQALEPPDYTQENYTRALWFSEGCTSTAASMILLRAGLTEEAAFLRELAGQISQLELSPARLTQSVEQSSLDAWLEKYDFYRSPERSISYYNKGFLVGILLDLQLRESSQGKVGLRDLFQAMNREAQRGKFFAESAGIEKTAEAVAHTDLSAFLKKYVAGTEEVPWDDFFRPVGLRLVRETKTVADLGFWAPRNFDKPLTVVNVSPGSNAERAGLRRNDFLLKFNGHNLAADFPQRLAALQPGESIRLRVRNATGEHDVEWTVGGRETVEFTLRDVENIDAQQKARRAAWLQSRAAEVTP